jgi:hypothetical protein
MKPKKWGGRHAQKWLVRTDSIAAFRFNPGCEPGKQAIHYSLFSIHHSVRLFAANQFKCFSMNHLQAKLSFPGQARSSLIKLNQTTLSQIKPLYFPGP